jgi:ribosomal protein S18 acetylase RimI-like enzyme
LRKATLEHCPQLVELMAEAFAEAGYTLNRRHAKSAFAAIVADRRLGYVWLIQADSKTVGYLVMTLVFSMDSGGFNAFVEDLYVQAPHRNRGLGKKALAETRRFCNTREIRAMSVEVGRENLQAQGVYRRTGFVATDRQLMTLRLADLTHIM